MKSTGSPSKIEDSQCKFFAKSMFKKTRRTWVKYFCPHYHPLNFLLEISAMLLYLPTSHLDWSSLLVRNQPEVPPFCSLLPEDPSPLLQDLGHSCSFPNAPANPCHLINLPILWELRLGLSYSYIETIVHHHCSSPVTGNQAVRHTKGAHKGVTQHKVQVCASR